MKIQTYYKAKEILSKIENKELEIKHWENRLHLGEDMGVWDKNKRCVQDTIFIKDNPFWTIFCNCTIMAIQDEIKVLKSEFHEL